MNESIDVYTGDGSELITPEVGQKLWPVQYDSILNEWVTKDTAGVVQIIGGGGGGGATLRNVTTTDLFSTANETINCTSGTFTVNLPTAVGIQGTIFILVNSGAGIITLDANGAETINGSQSIELTTQISRSIQSNGANWIII